MENIEIRKADLMKNGGAKIDLAFNTTEFGPIVIKGFRVSRSKKDNGLWVQVPSYPSYGRYFPTFFVENEGAWKDIESLLQDKYLEMETADENSLKDEEVSPEDIPF